LDPSALTLRNRLALDGDALKTLAVWISDLLAHGLIRASFVPPAPVQDLRDLTRTRTQLTREVAQHVLRIQKTLEDANVKLVSVISDIMGMSGRRILKAMIAGETNVAKLAGLGSSRLKVLPVDAGRLHCHMRDALRCQPIRQLQ
jgi:hypothetical protein